MRWVGVIKMERGQRSEDKNRASYGGDAVAAVANDGPQTCFPDYPSPTSAIPAFFRLHPPNAHASPRRAPSKYE